MDQDVSSAEVVGMHLASPDSGGLNCADAMGVVVVCVGVPGSGVVAGPLHAPDTFDSISLASLRLPG